MSENQAPQPQQAAPYCHVYEYDSPLGLHRALYPKQWNGKLPDRTVPVYTHPAPAAPSEPQTKGAAPESYTVDAVAWEAFVRDWGCYVRGDARMPFSELREGIAAVIDSAEPAAQAPAPVQQVGELPTLPEPYTKAGREMAPTFQPLFSREQMHAYARAALASQPAARVALTKQQRESIVARVQRHPFLTVDQIIDEVERCHGITTPAAQEKQP